MCTLYRFCYHQMQQMDQCGFLCLKGKIGEHPTYQNIKLNVLHGLLKMEFSVQKTLVEMSQVYLSPNLFRLPPFSGKNIPVSLQIIYLKKVVELI